MASIINATSSGSGGLVSTGDDSGELQIQTDGTARVVIDSSGNVTIQGQGDLRLADSDSSHYVALQAPGTVASNVTFTLPSADGTNGQLLQTNGSGTLSFTTPSSGALVYIASATASNSAAVDLNTGFSSSYNNYYITFENCTTTSAGSALAFQIYLAGVLQTGSVYGYQYLNTNATAGQTTLTYSTFKDMNTDASNEIVCGYLNVFDANNTRSRAPMFLGYSVRSDSYTGAFLSTRYGTSTTSAVTGIRFISQSGNINTGTFRLYGIKNS